MRRSSSRWPLVFALVAWIAPGRSARAQQSARVATVATTARAASPSLKVLGLSDYATWNRITAASLSADGKWVTYTYQPNDGDATLFVKQLDGTTVYSTSVGAPAGGGRGGGFGGGGGGGGPQFSDDSHWVAYYVNPPTPAPGASGRGSRGAVPPGAQSPGRGAPGGGSGGRGQRRLELLDLTNGAKFSVPNPAGFQFSKGSHWLAVRLNRAAGADTSVQGTDLLVRDLSTGTIRNVGNVVQYDFDDAGRLLAYTVDATSRLGNGIYLLELASGLAQTLDGAAADYDQLAWSDSGSNLAVLRGEKQRANRQKDNTLLAWTALGTTGSRNLTYDPSHDAAFPKGMVISEFTPPRWSADGARIFVGVKEQEPEPPRSEEPRANVDVWHWKDAEPQSVQMVRLQQERRATYPGELLVGSGRFLVLADSAMRTLSTSPNGKWAVGRNDTTYRGEVAWSGGHADYYRVSLETGERTPIASKLTRTMGISPDGRWFLYLQNKHVMAYDLESGKAIAVDAAAGRSFVNDEDDHDYEKPVFGVAGWSKDGHSVLLYDKYDLWQLPLDGGKAVNLTRGIGAAQQIEFHLVRYGAGGRGGRGGGFGGGSAEDAGIDLSQPLTLSAYGEWTKKTGFWRVAPGQAPAPLRWEDKQFGTPQKASEADRVLYTEQTFNEFPDYWVASTSYSNPTRVTDANPQLSEYAWGSKVLIDYKNSKGRRLQATLTLPAGYQPGKKYPMLVYFYEIMSNTHHSFSMPVYDDRPHMSEYASDGYLVLQPDVVYEIGKPGTSAVDCVTAAVKKVIALGYADPAHIGLQGHSWGGYQSSYILTQTDIFAAVVTGAPPTNLISFYDELYKQTGTVQQGITEVGQVRMGDNVTPWNSHDLYESQSPVYNVRNIKTPFLILQGTADGAVDWVEGLQFFNAARRNGKQVIFLSYPDEPHHLAKKENQKDFQVRMKQFFDHYLKGAPAPQWMTDGVPQVHKGGPIQ